MEAPAVRILSVPGADAPFFDVYDSARQSGNLWFAALAARGGDLCSVGLQVDIGVCLRFLWDLVPLT